MTSEVTVAEMVILMSKHTRQRAIEIIEKKKWNQAQEERAFLLSKPVDLHQAGS
jgi:hypothetical protein